MRANVLKSLKSPLVLEDRPDPEPTAGHVVVSLRAAALNRRDYWITRGKYPGITLPVVLGSDGAGVVTGLGEGISDEWDGAEVLVNPGWNWGDDPAAQSNDFTILGLPHDGTLAERVVVPIEYVHWRPEHLDWHHAAALPLAGVTAYRATFTRGAVQSGETVLITGIGGGVATFALQFARAAGATVVVTSSSEEKRNRATEAGAAAAYDYTEEGWAKRIAADHGPVSLVIDGAGGNGYSDLLDLVAPGGRIVNYGATAGPPDRFDPFKLFWKQLNLLGTTMGSPDDFTNMLAFVEEHAIQPIVDEVFPLERANDALERMADTRQFGKIVVECTAE